jgi:hypothetical protein
VSEAKNYSQTLPIPAGHELIHSRPARRKHGLFIEDTPISDSASYRSSEKAFSLATTSYSSFGLGTGLSTRSSSTYTVGFLGPSPTNPNGAMVVKKGVIRDPRLKAVFSRFPIFAGPAPSGARVHFSFTLFLSSKLIRRCWGLQGRRVGSNWEA